MFGRNKGDKPDLDTYATYCGGHKAYPSTHTCKLKIFAEHIEITKPELSIPFAKISKVEYTKTPTIGFVNNGSKTFTVITYNDGVEDQRIVLQIADVLGARNLDKAQGMLYERTQKAKQV